MAVKAGIHKQGITNRCTEARLPAATDVYLYLDCKLQSEAHNPTNVHGQRVPGNCSLLRYLVAVVVVHVSKIGGCCHRAIHNLTVTEQKRFLGH